MPHWIEEVFGTTDLYEVLGCPRDAPRSALRKAYYRSALKHHPDKNSSSGEDSHRRFQAVSLAYQILENDERRAEYDTTGIIPGDDSLDGDFGDGTNQAGVDQWKEYFDRIFGRVTTSKIDAFAQKYKCSDEERRDVLAAFARCKGNLAKMIDIVLVSEFRDATRWVEDYLKPAMDDGQLDRKFEAAMHKSLKVCQKKAQQQDEATETEEEEEDDNDEEEMEEDEELEDDERQASSRTAAGKKGKPSSSSRTSPKKSPKKAGKTRAKKPKFDDLVAAIQNKGRGTPNVWASLGARYGVSMDDDDPLSGDQFDKAQARMLQNKSKGGQYKPGKGKRK